MTDFDLWVRGCEINEDQIYCLESSDKPYTGLYETKRQYWCDYDHNYYWSSPMYHAWVNDEHTVSRNYLEAETIYKDMLDKL